VVTKAQQRDVPIQADYVARTDGVQTVEIRARVAGYLQTVGFVAGGLVRKDQVLFTIQPDEYQAALQSAKAQEAKAYADLTKAQDAVTVARAEASVAQAKAQLAKSQRDVARFRPLAAAQAVPQTDLDTAMTSEEVAAANLQSADAALSDTQLSQRVAIASSKAAVDSAKAQVTTAQLNLSYATIRSPLNGVAGFVKVDPGNYISAQSSPVLTTVSTIDPIKVTFGLSEADYLRVIKAYQWDAKQATPALTLTLADGSVYPLKGTPQHVDRALDPKTGTISVDATFPNPNGILRPGQFARIGFAIATRKGATVIPSRAVMKLQGIDVVYVVGSGNEVEQRSVTLGPRYKNDVVIDNGLKPGETIVLDGTQKVQPGGTVIPSQPATK
jgi:membrane fusion protein (multidrug efflux system)